MKETEGWQKAEDDIDSLIYDEPIKRGSNVDPVIVEPFKVIETSTTGFKLEGKVKDEDNDKLTVTLSGLKNNPKAQRITETNAEAGVTVTIDALKGQDNYTEYDWTVTVMDTARVSVTSEGKNKTYCPATECTGPFPETQVTCYRCNGKKTQYTCRSGLKWSGQTLKYGITCCDTSCGWSTPAGGLTSSQMPGYVQSTYPNGCPATRYGTCPTCRGTGTNTQITPCTHNKTKGHWYCEEHKVECGENNYHA